jgi:hypothetical protein
MRMNTQEAVCLPTSRPSENARPAKLLKTRQNFADSRPRSIV